MPSKPKRNTSLATSFLQEIEGGKPQATLAVKPMTSPSQRKRHMEGKAERESISRFDKMMADGDYHKFNAKDWITYYSRRFKDTFNVRYMSSGVKDSAVMKSLLQNLDWEEIKLMIDFVFDCDHDLYNARQIGIFAFSKGWLNATYQSAHEWQAGTYKKKSEMRKLPRRNREWNVASPKVDAETAASSNDVVIDW